MCALAELEEHFFVLFETEKGGPRVGVWCLLVSAKPVKEANTSRVKPDRLAWGRDQQRLRTASGEKTLTNTPNSTKQASE